MVRIKALLTFVLVVLLLVAPFNLSPRVRAGDINNPEIVDTEGDSASGKTSHDILWAFMGYETNDTFAAVMGMKTLDTFTDPSQIQTVPVTTYEFYFTIKGVNYAATASVPVHGPFGIDIRFALNTVEYNGTTPSKETNKASITGRYDAAHGMINMTVTKSSVGGVEPGDRATNLWCGVYSKQRSSGINMTTPVLEDRAPDNGYGTDFIYVGSPEGQIVALDLSTSSNLPQNITAFTPLKFELSVFNNGTNSVVVTMRNGTVNSHFNVSFSSPPSGMTLEKGRSANITMAVKIKDLRNTKDGETITITVWAETNIGNSTNPVIKTSNYIYFTVRASIPTTPVKPPTGTAKFFDDLSKFFRNNKNTVIGLIGFLIVLALVLVVYSKLGRGKKEEEFEDLQVHEKHPKKKDEEKEEAED
jgi:hypothetical protein